MEEVQSWWEVPSIAHFCYVFRSAFNLFFFEIAELESAILNIQDPDMSISLEQLFVKILQGFYNEDELVNEENWEAKLQELFSENLDDDDENPLDGSSFYQLTPRSKVEILFKLCELRLDVEGTLEEIKDIPSEHMQAKYIGKDSQNHKYWYFCDERLYKEDSSAGNKAKQLKNKNAKNTPKKQSTIKEKRTKANLDIDKSWTVACSNISEWEKFMEKFSKSRSSKEKELASTIKDHLPYLQERAAEKDRLLRRRYLELAPKRSSSRISKVQEKKKVEEQKAAEEVRLAKIEAEKERIRKENQMLKMKKESRQKRIEKRHKDIEERAERAKLRELSKQEDSSSNSSDDDDYSSDDDDDEDEGNEESEESSNDYDEPSSSEKEIPSRTRKSRQNLKSHHEENYSAKKIEFSDKDCESNSRKVAAIKLNTKAPLSKSSRYIHTYSNYTQQSRSGVQRVSARHQSNIKSVKCDSDKSEQYDSVNTSKRTSSRLHATQNDKESSNSEESDDENSNGVSSSASSLNGGSKNASIKTDTSKKNTLTLPNNYFSRSQNGKRNVSNNVTVCKTVLQNSSDVSKWNAAFGSKEQKMHVLHSSHDNLASKKVKLEQVNFKAVSPGMKSSLSKENQIFKSVHPTNFITYGKIIPSTSIVKLEYRKPPNPPVSS